MDIWGDTVDPSGSEKPAQAARITSVRLFAEAPVWVEGRDAGDMEPPWDFIKLADREMGLAGGLIAYVHDHGLPPPEYVARLSTARRKAFFSGLSKSPVWRLFHNLTPGGMQYNLLVEFARPRPRGDVSRIRQKVSDEYEAWFQKELMDCLAKNPAISEESAASQAMAAASHRVMAKYGMTTKEMGDIIERRTSMWPKWS